MKQLTPKEYIESKEGYKPFAIIASLFPETFDSTTITKFDLKVIYFVIDELEEKNKFIDKHLTNIKHLKEKYKQEQKDQR